MERTLALLAFDNPEESPFGDLLNMMQRQKVRSNLNDLFNALPKANELQYRHPISSIPVHIIT